jgi:hypothetical protein
MLMSLKRKSLKTEHQWGRSLSLAAIYCLLNTSSTKKLYDNYLIIVLWTLYGRIGLVPYLGVLAALLHPGATW